jgi:hypothetical protein
LEAQTGAYNYAKRVYPAFADRMKKPPYLIWRGSVVLLRGLWICKGREKMYV